MMYLLPAPTAPLALPAPRYTDNVYAMDALAFLRCLPEASVDAVITDPPYGLYNEQIYVVDPDTGGMYNRINEQWDRVVPTSWLAECNRILKPGGSVLCFGARMTSWRIIAEAERLGWKFLNEVIWYKTDAPPNFTGRMLTESTERLLWYCPSGTRWTYNNRYAKWCNRGNSLRDVWAYGQTRETRLHPTQKPLPLMDRIVRLFTRPNDVICDPFAGSGTTAVAARNTGRRYVVNDNDPHWYGVTCERLAAPFTIPMPLDAPAPTPAAVQEALL